MSSGKGSKTDGPKTAGYGLSSQAGNQVPLKEISVDIKIIGFVAEVTSSLLYTNSEDSPIEAEFTFPVDDGSAVFKFEAEIEGRRIVAEIQEKEQAKLTYEDAIEKGSTAMLLKEDDTAGDIFQCTLGNLPPKTDAKISFCYVIELPQEPDGKIRFTLPTVLNPRYSPDAGGVVAAEGATYTAPASIPYKFNMTGSVRGYHKVLSVTSEHDKLKVERAGEKLTSIVLAEDFNFDHDLSFLVEYENCYLPQVVLEMGDSNAAGIMQEDMLMVNFYPKLEETGSATATGEYIFVIDRSGSMGGARINNAKEALFLFLKSLPAGCYFNVISFGSSYSSLFKLGSSQYNKSNLKDALSLQKKMDADMGGTEILEPLKNVFGKKVIKGHPRQLILLTDGEVGNTDKVIGLVKSNSHSTRVFTLGIGSGVSTSLIKGVALAGNGKAEFISDKDRIQPKVISLLKCATQPSVSNIELTWDLPEGITAAPIPSQPPTFIGIGERLCLYTLLTGGRLKSSAKKCSVNLTGQYHDKPVDFKMEFSVPSESEINESYPLHRLAAKTQIKLLETEHSELLDGESFMYRSDNVDKLSTIKQKLLMVSKSANIVSQMTAFVAVDKEAKERVEGEMVKRPCPIPVASQAFKDALFTNDLKSCGLFDGGGGAMLQNYSLASARSYQKKSFGFPKLGKLFSRKSKAPPRMACAAPPSPKLEMCADSMDDDLCCAMSDEMLDEASYEVLPAGGSTLYEEKNKLLEMIYLQEIEGYWPFIDEVIALLEVGKHALKDIAKDSSVATTLAVVVWLRSKFRQNRDEWEMIETKACTWLSSKLDKDEILDDVLEEVKKQLWPDGLEF